MLPCRWTCSLSISIAVLASALCACDDGGDAQERADIVAAVDAAASQDAPGDASEDDIADADTAPDGADDAVDATSGVRPIATEFTVVELAGDAPPTLRLAVRACEGLNNRVLGGSIYVRQDEHDARWLAELGLEPAEVVDAVDFVAGCVAEIGACVRYSYDEQQALLPNVLTVAAAIGAVPVDVGLEVDCAEVAFDATVEFADRATPELATRYVYENYLGDTTGLAMLNPGYSTSSPNPASPELSAEPRTTMVDFVFSERLFVVFLIQGWVPPHPENQVLQAIVDESGWPSPLGVYGYNNSWLVGGYLYEAQTRCLNSRNMGAIPTETGNLSFFSTRRAPIEDVDALERNPPDDVEYDPDMTYAAFVIGDGDNIRFMMSSRGEWLRQRLADCEQADNSCEPITWSISPHLARIAPDVLQWYYASSARTGHDYFTLPPSGHLYAYPTSLDEVAQDAFVAATERDARLLGVGSTVHWEWYDSWRDASIFLPKYATAEGAIRGILPVNVPYMVDAFPWWGADEFYRVLGGDGGSVVVFRPREWRGVGGTDNASEAEFFVTPQEMADEFGGYPRGTVTEVYMTSDGGLSLENSVMELVGLLPPHVQLVSADTASRLALAADAD